ncbi:MAG: TusE/DsrC/DsvC family sulfur relay protein [Hydrogenophilales bacterium]|nr:TusE/DsrC/DsvC family sulfur relay protein [Hydrogenophilales bacterium]
MHDATSVKKALQTPKGNYLAEAKDGTNPYAIYTRSVTVDGQEILTDQEGYILDMDAWSPGFAQAQAAREGLTLTHEHWEVIRFIREYYEQHNVQAQVRDMIRYFREAWGSERGNNHYLHDLFPMGGPQKQGNRVAGIRKTKGEH